MKSLDQIEPRRVISSAPYTISSPGAYYLTGNISVLTGDAITIAADDVSLDLNGFTIISSANPAAGNAVTFSGARERISIFNGHIRGSVSSAGDAFTGSGFDSGINWTTTAPTAVRVCKMNVAGMKTFGIDVGSDGTSLVESCMVKGAESIGIRAGVVSNCVVSNVSTLSGTAVIAAKVTGTTGINTSGIRVITAAQQGEDLRTAISSPTTITTPGSYFLTQNISVTSGNGITINASNVTLDLNGFSISSTANPAAGSGIVSSSVRTSVVIRNGAIRGSVIRTGSSFAGNGFQNGISMPSNVGVEVENVQISGMLVSGILLPTNSSHAKTCTIVTCGGIGLQAESVEGCSVTDIGGIAISSKIASKCVGANEVGTAHGITADIATDCRGSCVAGSGISALTVNNSYGTSSNGVGIEATTANNSEGGSTIGTGIVASTVNNSTGTSITGHGINASLAVMNSFGFGGGTGDGIRCTGGVVTNSFGKIRLSGTGIGLRALTANGSRGVNISDAVSQVITNKYNMP
jgi:hypothetical protein